MCPNINNPSNKLKGMNFMKKKLLSVALCAALVFAMAVPAFAASQTSILSSRSAVPSYNKIYWLACWNGQLASDGYAKILNGKGSNETMTVEPMRPNGRYMWQYLQSPHGNGAYLRNVNSPYEVVNVYRVLQSGIYYLCRGYWYEGNGRDQRISVNGSQIYLTDPVMGGTWYLQADYSAIHDSPVIFYTDGSREKAQWLWGDAEY